MKNTILGIFVALLLSPSATFAYTPPIDITTIDVSQYTTKESLQELRILLMKHLVALLQLRVQELIALRDGTPIPAVLGVATTTEAEEDGLRPRGGGGGGGSRSSTDESEQQTVATSTATSTDADIDTTSPLTVEFVTDIILVPITTLVNFGLDPIGPIIVKPKNGNVVVGTTTIAVITPEQYPADVVSKVWLAVDSKRFEASEVEFEARTFGEQIYTFNLDNRVGILAGQEMPFNFSVEFDDRFVDVTNTQTIQMALTDATREGWAFSSNQEPVATSSYTGADIIGPPARIISYGPVLEDIYLDHDIKGDNASSTKRNIGFLYEGSLFAINDDYELLSQGYFRNMSTTSTEFQVLGHAFTLTGPVGFTATTTLHAEINNQSVGTPYPRLNSGSRHLDFEITAVVDPSLPGEYTLTFDGATVVNDVSEHVEAFMFLDISDIEDLRTTIDFSRYR